MSDLFDEWEDDALEEGDDFDHDPVDDDDLEDGDDLEGVDDFDDDDLDEEEEDFDEDEEAGLFEDADLSDLSELDDDDVGRELIDAVAVSCPYCNAEMELVVDPVGGEHQEYVEDCEVCCQPWMVRVTIGRDGVESVELSTQDEG